MGGGVLSLLYPARISSYPALVDWPTIFALAGLLLLTKGIETSGFLNRLASHLIQRITTERQLALFLVIAAALVSMALTNDVSLFILVPLTISLHRLAHLPVRRLVIYEALAVNAGSALTPIGNPQNLFLWQVAKVHFVMFMWQMLPLIVILLGLLLLATLAGFPGKRIQIKASDDNTDISRPVLIISLLLYAPFLALTDTDHPAIALALVLAVYMAACRRIIGQVDWMLIIMIMLMFIDLRMIASLPVAQTVMHHMNVSNMWDIIEAGIASSQVISNVPATILLAEYTKRWPAIAYGATIGGFGIAWGSLANLIALRMLNERRAWLVFHLYSVPFLVLSGLLTWLIINLVMR